MKQPEPEMTCTAEWVEVRLLGPLRVRRADGELVHDREWRTGKNADLLRWLALSAGEPVPVEVLAEELWPGVDENRARASLRTAASALRRVLGSDVVERLPHGLALTGSWVDTSSFLELADDVARHARAGRAADALAAAREADALYLADVPVGDGAPAVIGEHSGRLAMAHTRLLADAADAAVQLGWMRDAVDFAGRLAQADPLSERASRSLMLGFRGLGEVDAALREFTRLRLALSDELGTDPSPQTRAVHLQVLQPALHDRPAVDTVGRSSEGTWLDAVLAGSPRPSAAGGALAAVVVLSGAPGSGRRHLVSESCRRTGLPLVAVASGSELRQQATARPGHVLLWEPEAPGLADLDVLGQLLLTPPAGGPAAVVLLTPAQGTAPAVDSLPRSDMVRGLELEPLLHDDVATLATRVLASPPTPGLVQELAEATGGLPGAVLAMVRDWASSGRVVMTSSGLALAPTGSSRDEGAAHRRALAKCLPRLSGDALEGLLLAAVLDQPVTPSLLAPVLVDSQERLSPAEGRARSTAVLERLLDLGLLRSSSAGAVWRHPLLRDAVYAWVRPAMRARLHRRVAEQALISSSSRIEHWLQAGERELACVAALEAAGDSSARGDHASARTHLMQVCRLGDLPEAAAGDRLSMFERLGDTCALLRRPDEALAAYQQALEIGVAQLLADVPRLRRKTHGSADRRVLEQGPTPAGTDRFSALHGLSSMSHPDAALEAALQDLVTEADRSRDNRTRVQARLQMAGAVHLPRRQFRAAHEWVESALALAPRPEEQLRAALVRQIPNVLLGGAQAARGPLEALARAAEGTDLDHLRWRLLAMRVLVAHDLGDLQFEPLWAALCDRVLTGPVDRLVPGLAVVAVRVLVEREELDLALDMSQHLAMAGGQDDLVHEHLSRIALAELAGATGDTRRAADLLRSVVDGGTASGCTLLVPEAAARLVALVADHDAAAARAAFDVYDDVVAAALGGPREEYWCRLARAAVRSAQGDDEGAAHACRQASALAAQHGLQVLAASARRARATYVQPPASRSLALAPLIERTAG